MDLEGRQDPGQGRQGREAAGPLPSFSTQVFQSPAPRCPAGRVSRLLPLVSLTLSQVAYGSASGHLWHLLGSQAAHQACLPFWGSLRRCAGAREGADDAVKLVLLPGLRRALLSLSLPRPGGLSPDGTAGREVHSPCPSLCGGPAGETGPGPSASRPVAPCPGDPQGRPSRARTGPPAPGGPGPATWFAASVRSVDCVFGHTSYLLCS